MLSGGDDPRGFKIVVRSSFLGRDGRHQLGVVPLRALIRHDETVRLLARAFIERIDHNIELASGATGCISTVCTGSTYGTLSDIWVAHARSPGKSLGLALDTVLEALDDEVRLFHRSLLRFRSLLLVFICLIDILGGAIQVFGLYDMTRRYSQGLER